MSDGVQRGIVEFEAGDDEGGESGEWPDCVGCGDVLDPSVVQVEVVSALSQQSHWLFPPETVDVTCPVCKSSVRGTHGLEKVVEIARAAGEVQALDLTHEDRVGTSTRLHEELRELLEGGVEYEVVIEDE